MREGSEQSAIKLFSFNHYGSLDQLLAPAGVLLLCAFHIFLGWQFREGLSRDFPAFYAAAMTVRQGEGEKLYNREVQLSLQKEASKPLIFNHLAYESLIWVPLTYLPFRTAAWIWLGFNIALLALVSSILKHSLPPPILLPWVVILFAFPPVFYGLLIGQNSVLLLLGYVLSFTAYRKRRLLLSGAFLSIGLFKFHLIIPFVAIMGLQKKWRLIVGFLIGSIPLLLISYFVTGSEGFSEYLRLLTVGGGGEGIYPPNMPNIRGFTHLLLNRLVPPSILFAVIGVMSLALIIWVGTRDLIGIDLYSSALLGTILSSFHIYNYDLALMIIPLTVLMQRPTPIVFLTSLLFFLTPLYLIFASFGYTALFTVGLLILLTHFNTFNRNNDFDLGSGRKVIRNQLST